MAAKALIQHGYEVQLAAQLGKGSNPLVISEFLIEAIRGNISGFSGASVSGENPDIDTASGDVGVSAGFDYIATDKAQ